MDVLVMQIGRAHTVGAADVDESVRQILADVLALDPATSRALREDTPLFGALPELDSMSVAGLLTQFEDRFGIVIDDEDVDSEVFSTFGTLTAMLRAKLV
jgi:acyl carrier protein